MGFIIDTDVLSLLWRNHEKVAARVIAVGAEPLAITIVTYIELLRPRLENVYKAANAAELDLAAEPLAWTQKHLEGVRVFQLDPQITRRFDQLRLTKKHKKMGRADLLNACFALV